MRAIAWSPTVVTAILLSATMAIAQGNAGDGKNAEELARELSDPGGSLASLTGKLEYSTFRSDLSNADNQVQRRTS